MVYASKHLSLQCHFPIFCKQNTTFLFFLYTANKILSNSFSVGQHSMMDELWRFLADSVDSLSQFVCSIVKPNLRIENVSQPSLLSCQVLLVVTKAENLILSSLEIYKVLGINICQNKVKLKIVKLKLIPFLSKICISCKHRKLIQSLCPSHWTCLPTEIDVACQQCISLTSFYDNPFLFKT